MKRRKNVVDQNRHVAVKDLKIDSRGRRKQIKKKVIKSGVGEVKYIKK